ncbi:hypothetical protein ASPZODRAFT_141678 [Penicilliopsis zonata CBS 506.65]|uniref:Xylanolytic transcriptional activator regulatory domain-containing protein n=1 Tax=Penicilliopsis zonata CBS 506.65 TaxID=1073090 RepID=A0A1L9SIC8_9EURO|nr:hypothetical protein ASPZODRAFT_141678 [Penicilliopsis zonata CBS 506.65]OJJ46897.1 hypothetical protein ASPZODRAFT_141678 [Penicilliopsis zonata CBS 506.65]
MVHSRGTLTRLPRPLSFSRCYTHRTSASAIAASFLSRTASAGPQVQTQTLDANQLHQLYLTLGRPCPWEPSRGPPEGTPIPPGYHLVYFTPRSVEAALGPDGSDASYNTDHPFTRRMWAGGEVVWARDEAGKTNPLRVGQEVRETTRVLSAEGKVVRRTGEEMIVVGVEKEFSNEDGLAVVDRRNWVFRKALTGPPAPSQSSQSPSTSSTSTSKSTSTSPSASSTGSITRTLTQTDVTLFRFSALTFNAHKIHYSIPWAREVEGHPNIVVHGPLNLICILDLWRDSRDDSHGPQDLVLPQGISYRATSPLYAGETYTIALDDETGRVIQRREPEYSSPAHRADTASKANRTAEESRKKKWEYGSRADGIRLKCDRIYPCTPCQRRGEPSGCAYVGRGPRGRPLHSPSSNTSHVQDRLQHLENLVLSLTQQKVTTEQSASITDGSISGSGVQGKQSQSQSQSPAESVPQVTPPSSSGEAPEAQDKIPSDAPGKLVVREEGTSYIDSAHWRAILEEINEVKESLQENSDFDDDEDDDTGPCGKSGPSLLFGMGKAVTLDELLADLPPRPVADLLVSQFLNSMEPAVVVLHFPTFRKQYNQFWENSSQVSLSWLALLNAIFTLAVILLRRKSIPLPNALGSHAEALCLFRKCAVQCLYQCRYTAPGKHKVEALLFYTLGVFLGSNDAKANVLYLLRITIQLAMRMGYHRDPEYYPGISALDGEVRRRMWAVLSQLDSLISYTAGLPKMVQSWQCDTRPPSNLFDEDIDESMARLPLPRPWNTCTPLSYTIAKSRIMAVFGRISDLAFSRQPVAYEETLEIDRSLEESHDLVPAFFQIRPIAECIGEKPEAILRRCTLEFLYQKARCVLHRRYMTEDRSNPRYAYSRHVCTAAAMEILRHQADIFQQSQLGGPLHFERLFSNSIQNHDFLLAAMIICLEVSFTPPGSVQERADLLAALEMSHRVFNDARQLSVDSQKAYDALTVMLRRTRKAFTAETSKDGTVKTLPTDLTLLEPLNPTEYTQMLEDPVSWGLIEGMLDAPSNINWHLWDYEMQGLQDEVGVEFPGFEQSI